MQSFAAVWRQFLVLAAALLLAGSGVAHGQGLPEKEGSGAAGETKRETAEGPNLGKRFWELSTERMGGVLSRLGNYSCIVHLDRYERTRRAPLLRKMDSVRLQITSFGGNEYYSLPGKSRTVTNPRELISTGLLATGIFQGYARTIFVDRGLSRLEFLGADDTGPRYPLRYRFQLDAKKHPLDIRVGVRGVRVPGQGAFWIDQADLRVRRIQVENTAPIRELGVRRALYVMDWAPVKTAAGEFLLPQRAEMRMEMEDGSVSMNEATMAQCREYRAESEIRFDGAEVDAAAGEEREADAGAGKEVQARGEEGEEATRLVEAASLRRMENAGSAMEIAPSLFLPGGLSLTLRLAEPLDLGRAAVGDEFRATVVTGVSRDGRELLPAGAEALGRVRRLNRGNGKGSVSTAWLEFTLLRAEGKEYLFLGNLTGHGRLAGLAPNARAADRGREEKSSAAPAYADFGLAEGAGSSVPGVAPFSFADGLGVLPAGFTMEWKTIPATP
jgi:hypothetical protein